MKRSSLYAVWGILYIICTGLGFIPEPEKSVRIFLLVIAVLFFVPPGVLMWDALQHGNRKEIRHLGLLAALSLGATAVMLVVSILTAFQAAWVGTVCHVLLVLVSTPMFCSNYWVVSLFLWAVLLLTAWTNRKGA